MQGAGHRHRGGNADDRSEQGRQIEADRKGVDNGTDQTDAESDQRETAGRAGQARQTAGFIQANRQPREEAAGDFQVSPPGVEARRPTVAFVLRIVAHEPACI
jgi:hypothetical protein